MIKTGIFIRFIPFWIFLMVYKFGAGLHYSLISPLGEELLPLWIVGLLMGICSVIQMLLDVPAGHLLDRFGYLRLLKLTTFIFLFAAFFIALGLTQTNYLLSLFFSIFGWLFFGPGVNAYVLTQAPKEHAGKFISLRDTFSSLGIVLSSVTLPLILTYSSQWMGIIMFSLLAISLIALVFAPKEVGKVQDEVKIETQSHYVHRHYLKDTWNAIKVLNPASMLLILLEFTGCLFYGVIWFVIPLVMIHQADMQILGLGLAAFDLSVVVLGYFLGTMADRANKRTLVFFGILLFAIAGMLLGFNFGAVFILFGFLATTGDEMAGIALWSWLHDLDKNHAEDGAVAGVINLFEDLGWAIGPIVAGVAYTLVGPNWTIFLGAIPIFTVWCIYQFFMPEHKVKRDIANTVPLRPMSIKHKS